MENKRGQWNVGLTVENSSTLKKIGRKISQVLKEKHASGEIVNHQKGKPRTPEERKKISDGMKRAKAGGYRQGSGRGKKGWYKGIFCDSSWELAYIIYMMEHGSTPKRNTNKFSYIYDGQERTYLPDFIMEDGSYVEVKGYNTEQWQAKLDQFPEKIEVIYKKEIAPYLKYVEDKYGKDFVKLYGE